jgi:Fe-S oxidoreductase
MKNEIAVLKQIKLQIAHCMAFYGDQPEELMYKLEQLVIEWFDKGINAGKGIELICPHCKGTLRVYHLEWTALTCKHCKTDIYQFE